MLSSIRPRLALAALAALLIPAAAAPAGAPAQSPIQLGVYLPGGGGNASTLDDYSNLVGRKPDIFLVFRDMSGPLLYSSEASNLRARGETPMVTLEPYTSNGVASFADIAAGKYDSFFREEADGVRGLGMTVMIRFAHEMNLLSSDWGPNKAGNTGNNYVEAWRHIVTIFRQEGAGNVQWVWAPNVDYGGRPFSQFYPGDEWVDYVGLDGYNWGTSEGDSFAGFSKIFASSYATISQLSSKPLIISETASSEVGGSKAAWIEEAFFTTIPQQMPRVSAVIWFNEDKERDWPVDSSQSSLAAYRKVVASSLYGGTEPTPRPAEPAPSVDELKVTPTVRLNSTGGSGGGSPSPVAHGRITYRLSRRAIVRIALRRRGRRGHRGGHGRRRARPLVFTAEQSAGHKRISLKKLVGKRRLGRGGYRVSVVAFSPTGTRSHPRRHGFKVVAPRQRRHRSAHS